MVQASGRAGADRVRPVSGALAGIGALATIIVLYRLVRMPVGTLPAGIHAELDQDGFMAAVGAVGITGAGIRNLLCGVGD
jgi:hypothetical protein